jgi:hypothetical protein
MAKNGFLDYNDKAGVMNSLVRKNQRTKRNLDRNVGVVIDCDEITISIYPPPREHGRAHCHVRSKKSIKTKGSREEIFPELKIYLDASELIVVTKGFSRRDIKIIGEIIFNDPKNGDISNDTYLQLVWEKLHGQL